MMVILKPDLFDVTPLVNLIPFLWLSMTPPGRHRIIVIDGAARSYQTWIAKLDQDIRVEWIAMIAAGLKDAERSQPVHEIEVDAIQDSRWSDPTPTLT